MEREERVRERDVCSVGAFGFKLTNHVWLIQNGTTSLDTFLKTITVARQCSSSMYSIWIVCLVCCRLFVCLFVFVGLFVFCVFVYF
jgi:hypothetical protein